MKKISTAIVSGKQPSADGIPLSQTVPSRRANSGPSALELIYNYSHYMYGALWVADDSVDGEKGTVCYER